MLIPSFRPSQARFSFAVAVLSALVLFLLNVAVAENPLTETEQMIPPSKTAPIDLAKLVRSTPEMIRDGNALFQMNCASCHGANGAGDGVAAPAMNPKPRNFTSLEGWTNGPKISQIFETLQNGLVRNAMPAFTQLSFEERFKLIHFIRSLHPDYPQDSPEDLRTLDQKYGLSKGQDMPGKIPVRMAMMLMAEDGDKHQPITAAASSQTGKAAGGLDGVRLFNKYACTTCHNIDRPDRLVGPSLYDVGSRLNPADIKESIVDPDAKVTPGYPPNVMGTTLKAMGFYNKVTPAELEALVQVLASRKGQQ